MTAPAARTAAADTRRAELLVFPSHELPLVSVSITRRVGAAIDPVGKEGLGRFTGRLMRRTGGGLTAEQMDEHIDALGASVGVESNHSALGLHAGSISRSFDKLTETLADIVGRPGFDEAELGRLCRETEAEIIESRDNDRGLARRWFRSELFPGHPYSRAVGGTIDSVRSLTLDDVRQHYAQTFFPDNLVISIAGDVSEDEADHLARQLESRLPGGERLLDDVPEPEMPKGRRLLLVDKPERTQTQILIGTLGTHPADEDHTALAVANTIFGGTFTARLSREVRSKRGWSYGAYSSLPYDRRRRGFSMWTFPKAEDAAPCIRLQLELLESLVGRGVSKSELSAAKRYLIRSHAFTVDTAVKRAALAAEEILYDLPQGFHDGYVERVRAVTLDQVNAAIENRLSTEDLLVVVVGTEKTIGTSLEGAIDGLADSRVVAYDDDV